MHQIDNSMRSLIPAMNIQIIVIVSLLTYTECFEFIPLESYGLNFDKVATAYNSYKNWNIYYHLNLKEMSIAMNDIKYNIDEINEICEKNQENITCRFNTQIINKKYESITKIMETFEILMPKNIKRSKRNLLPISSLKIPQATVEYLKHENSKENIANALFGSSFVDKTPETLRSLELKLGKTNDATRDQLNLINKTITLYNRAIYKLALKVNKLGKKWAQDDKNGIRNQKQQVIFDNLSNHTSQNIKTLKKMANCIINILLKTPSCDILEFLPIDQIYEEILSIPSQLKIQESLPFQPKNKIDALKLIQFENTINNQIFIIKISIPIVEKPRKTLYKLTKIPLRGNNFIKTVKIRATYAIINNDEYTPLTIQEVNACQQIEDLLICKPSFPTQLDKYCEFSIFRKRKSEMGRFCLFEDIISNNYVTPLLQRNTFFMTIKQPIHFSVIYGNGTITDKTLTQDGILKIVNDCELKNTNVKIRGYDEKSIYTSIAKKINTATKTQNTLTDSDFDQDNTDEDDVKDFLNDSITLEQNINEQTNEDTNESTDQVKVKELKPSGYPIVIFIITILFIFVLFILNRKFHIWDHIINQINQLAISTRAN